MAFSYFITGDWQADSRNLETIKKVVRRETDVMAEYGCSVRIDLGDLKNPYNPVDVRITQVMQERFRTHKSLVVMGNHDRLSQTDQESWLNTVVSDYVFTATQPRYYEDDDAVFFMLPYHRDVAVLRENAKVLAEQAAEDWNGREKVLLFHCGLTEADYGHGRLGLDELRYADLRLDNYDYAFGGHVHKPQMLNEGDGAYYVGSPVIQDWGEANQEKRFLIYTPRKGVQSVPVGLPGLYDWEYAKTMSPDALRGSTVRFPVPAKDSRQFREIVKKRQAQFAVKYPETLLHCIPEYQAGEVTDYSFVQGTDETKVQEYVKQVYGDAPELVKTVVSALEKVASVKSVNTEGVRFVAARGHNYTSFQDLKVDYRKQGIVLVNGRNEDWPGRSNGSGKTNLQDLIKIAMFGTTGHTQETANSWVNDDLTGPAWVELIFVNAQNQKIRVRRQRNPIKLEIWVDGVDKSSGLTGKEKDNSTQSAITEHSGYDLRMLTNAVYIDQERAYRFVIGTRKEKSELLYKFLGLERFQLARDLMSKEFTAAKREAEDTRKLQQARNVQVEHYQTEMPNFARRIAAAQEQLQNIDTDLNTLLQKLDQTGTVYDSAQERIRLSQIDMQELNNGISMLNTKFGEIAYARRIEHNKIGDLTATRSRANRVVLQRKEALQELQAKPLPTKASDCPTCGRSMNDLESRKQMRLSEIASLQEKLTEAQNAVPGSSVDEDIAQEIKRLDTEKTKVSAELDALEKQRKALESSRAEDMNVIQRYNVLLAQRTEKVTVQTLATERVKELEAELQEFSAKKARTVALLEQANIMVKNRDAELHKFERAVACLDRTGIPAYLCGQLCPVLTKSADHYASLFGDDALKIVFKFVDGDFDCEVFNSQGSSERLSVGEWATASLIAAFALRSVAPKTNVLVLDEPGRGLDELGQTKFAEALSQLRDEFESIYITSHEKAMQTAIEADSVLTVVKKSRISTVQQ